MPFSGRWLGDPRPVRVHDPALDRLPLTGQLGRVLRFMADGRWRTLNDIYRVVGGSEAGISARLRDFRKARFGRHEMEGRIRAGHRSLWEYRLVLSQRDIRRVATRVAALQRD